MSMSAAELPIALIIVVFVMGIGLIVFGNINTILDAQAASYNNTSFNSTVTSLQTNAFSGFDLGALLPIVIAAGAVISILLGAFSRFT